MKHLDPQKYYRLPWTFTDNAISWLEVTSKCNLNCKGCYRDRRKDGHKELSEIAEDLSVFRAHRKSDCVSIAGGDPLVHPKIVEIVRMVKEGGWKPIVNTNGLALTYRMLRDLKQAGVFGFTFHIDTSQKRRDALHATAETDLFALRESFARMLGDIGGITCSFNQTVSEGTLSSIPEVVKWAQRNSHLVQSMVFILYREPGMSPEYDYYANGEKVNMNEAYEDTGWGGKKILKAQDVVDKIREADPEFEPCSYLGGSCDPASMKWLLSVRVGDRSRTFGYASPKFMETVQTASHWFRRRWLSYGSTSLSGMGRSSALLFGTFDPAMRKSAKAILRSQANPANWFSPAYLQSYMVIQPVDFLPDGRMNMCDGCPDITVYKGKLHWSCRLEEIKRYGTYVTAVPARSNPN